MDDHSTSTPRGRVGTAARLALGLTVLVAERVRGPSGDAVHVGVGAASAVTSQVRSLAAAPVRLAARTVTAARAQARQPGAPEYLRRLDDRADRTRRRGQAIVDSSRTDALALVRKGVDGGLAWVERQAAPRVVDALVPHLVKSVVPRIVDGILPHVERAVVPQLIDAAMPVVRERVLPVVIEDLTGSSLLRTLVLDQGRGVVSHAADELRDATASADDKLEDLFRNLVHRARER